MDPLSITASIVGLLTAAAKINSLLEWLSSVRNSPTTIRDARNEVRHTEVALRSMQRLLRRVEAASPRREMIQVDELRVTLADAMLAFSTFETLLQQLAIRARARGAISWTKYSKQLDEHLARIERYKLSLTLMVSILQCDSDVEAYQNQEKLQILIEKVLDENTSLRQKLSQSQDSFAAKSIATRHPDDENSTIRDDNNDDSSTIRGVQRSNTVRSRFSTFGGSAIKFAFENILEQSRVYRKTDQYQECDRSFASTAQRSHAWSVFSGYSLADISVMSVIAMPLTTLDVANGQYYVIGSETILPDDRTDDMTAMNAVSTGLTGSKYTDDDADPQSGPAEGSMPVAEAGKSLPDASGEDGECGVPLDEDWPLGPADDMSDDEIFPCKGCGEILVEGKAFELAGNRWHLDCFRCSECNVLFDADSNLLLLWDGSLVCSDCLYPCHVCGKKIDDLAILTGDLAFCSSCFRCRNCKLRIENLRYARTSQGIFCMSCHGILMARRRKKLASASETEQGPGASLDTGYVLPSSSPLPSMTDSS
ncbi:uncharacterized protein B0H64DRAFT_398195 [Chaetomium fimeti]|uniref:LIM zinc-binding domain-containing protein n=1 Tax=Chaetomium fimeti TaxID=1854472 RepID=A0AAE0HH24_9PEZI|nr:hypothetical protein B0H64DRAFT_398195 [Chaetomium fimeti]